MRRSYLAALVAASMLAGGTIATGATAESGSGSGGGPDGSAGPAARKGRPGQLQPRWVEGELLVTFEPGVGRREARSFHGLQRARLLGRVKAFGGVDHVRLPAGVSVEQGLARYGADARVASVEPNLIRAYHNHVVPNPPNDDFFSDYWGLNNTGQAHTIADPPPSTAAGTAGADIDAPQAWGVPHSSLEPIVAVADSGVQVTHPDLTDQLWQNPGEIPSNGLDDDGNGFVDDVNGWNFGANNNDLSDPVPHGTHVAGTVAAETNNGPGATTGGVGVCPQCKIMVLKLGAIPTLAAELAAFSYAIAEGAHILNGSFGGGIWSKAERNAVKALGNAGILASFSAGNSALDNDLFLQGAGPADVSPIFPASYNLPAIISVAATNHHDEYGYLTGCALGGVSKAACAFSNVGHDSVDVAAPGVDIRSTVPTDMFASFDGTSMASPHVAGVAGLVKSVNPGLSPVAIKNAIMNSSNRPASLLTAHSLIYKRGKASGPFTRTSGRVNAHGAVTTTDFSAFGPSLHVATPKTDGNIDGAKRIRKSKRGRVKYPADVNDVFKKRLRKGKRYEVTLDVPKRKDYDLWVWKPKTKEIWQLEAGCFGPGRCKIQGASLRGKGKDEVVRFKARRGGKYFFQVSAWLKNKGRYQLTIRRI